MDNTNILSGISENKLEINRTIKDNPNHFGLNITFQMQWVQKEIR